MLLSEFIARLQSIEKESAGTHHNGGKVEVEFIVSDPADEIDIEVELDHVEPWRLMGCGCWAGAEVWLNVKRKTDA